MGHNKNTRILQFVRLCDCVPRLSPLCLRKYPRHRTNLGMLRFRTEGENNKLSKYRVSDGVWTVNAQFIVNNKRRSGGEQEL